MQVSRTDERDKSSMRTMGVSLMRTCFVISVNMQLKSTAGLCEARSRLQGKVFVVSPTPSSGSMSKA